MSYKKASAGLAAVLAQNSAGTNGELTVFIHTTHPPSDQEAAFLQALGVRGIKAGRKIFTATLSPQEIAHLGEQSWVRVLELSAPARMLKPH